MTRADSTSRPERLVAGFFRVDWSDTTLSSSQVCFSLRPCAATRARWTLHASGCSENGSVAWFVKTRRDRSARTSFGAEGRASQQTGRHETSRRRRAVQVISKLEAGGRARISEQRTPGFRLLSRPAAGMGDGTPALLPSLSDTQNKTRAQTRKNSRSVPRRPIVAPTRRRTNLPRVILRPGI